MGFELWHISHIVYTFALFLNPVLHKLGVVSIYQSLNDPNVKLGLESLPAFPNSPWTNNFTVNLLLVVGLMHTVSWLLNDRASAKTLMVGRLAMGALNLYDMWTGASPKSFITPAAVEIGTGLLGFWSLVLAPPAKLTDGKLKK